MKNLIIGLSLASVTMFSACQEQNVNCRDNVTGDYVGVIIQSGDTSSISTFVNTGFDDKGLLISFYDPNWPLVVISGTLNADCSAISIDQQSLGGMTNASGTFFVNGNNISGTLQDGTGNLVKIDVDK